MGMHDATSFVLPLVGKIEHAQIFYVLEPKEEPNLEQLCSGKESNAGEAELFQNQSDKSLRTKTSRDRRLWQQSQMDKIPSNSTDYKSR